MNNANIKPFVFVLMPFHSDFDDIYQVGIKAACQAVGAYCERVDEQIFVENILDRVYNQIAKADIVISEMTGRNPNVFYETGYAHAVNKRVILLTQNADDIPFDLKQYPHIVYGGKIAQLKFELEKRIKWCIDNPYLSIPKVELEFEFLINGIAWKEGLLIEIPCEYEIVDKYGNLVHPTPEEYFTSTGNLIFSLQVGFHNISNSIIESSRYHLGLVIPNEFSVRKNSGIDAVTKNGQFAIIRLLRHSSIFPDDWDSSHIDFSIQDRDFPISSVECNLRLFSEFGVKDYKFKVNLIRNHNYGNVPIDSPF